MINREVDMMFHQHPLEEKFQFFSVILCTYQRTDVDY